MYSSGSISALEAQLLMERRHRLSLRKNPLGAKKLVAEIALGTFEKRASTMEPLYARRAAERYMAANERYKRVERAGK